jgi:hypothetical protein
MAWLDHTTINMQPTLDFSRLHHSITDGIANFINYLQALAQMFGFFTAPNIMPPEPICCWIC